MTRSQGPIPSVVVEAWIGTVRSPLAPSQRRPSGSHSLGVIGPQRDGMNFVAGIDHERGIDRSHGAATDYRNLCHLVFSVQVASADPRCRGRDQHAAGAGAAFDFADIAFETRLAGGKQPQRIGIDAVLYPKDSRRQRLRRVVIGDRNRALHQDRTGIGFRNDKMHGGAGNLHAGAQRLALRVEPRKRRQQRRMNVEHAAIPALHEFGRQQPHESAEANQLDPMLLQRGLQHRFERRAVFAERLAFDRDGRNAAGPGPFSPPASARLEITTTISAGKSLDVRPRSARPCSIRARRSGWRRGASWPHHARSYHERSR